MQIVVRKVLDIEHPNLETLTRKEKLYLAIKSKYVQSKSYQMKRQKELNAQLRKKVIIEDNLKEQILALLYKELVENSTLQDKGLVTKSVVIQVKRKYEEALHNILRHKDFISYSVMIVPENPDFLKAFKNLPILVRFSKKELGG